jgi:hypothetical protein
LDEITTHPSKVACGSARECAGAANQRWKVRIPTMPPTHSDLIAPTVPI